jgi:hypothetical protein
VHPAHARQGAPSQRLSDETLYEWAERVADALELPPELRWAASRDTAVAILDLARVTAHGVSRPAAPLTSFLLGINVGLARHTGPGALAEARHAIEAALAALPPAADATDGSTA